MALIYCSKCGKQVSDKAAVCPHCNQVLRVQQAAPAQAPVQIPAQAPQSQTVPAPAAKKSKFPIIMGIVIVLLIGSTAAICAPMFISARQGGANSVTSSADSVSGGVNTVPDDSGYTQPSWNVTQPPVQTTAATERSEFTVVFTVTTVEGIISDYDIDFYVDGSCVDSIGAGMTKQYTMTLSKGSHVIQVKRSKDGEKEGSTTLNVSEDMEVNYSVQLRTGFGRDIVISRS